MGTAAWSRKIRRFSAASGFQAARSTRARAGACEAGIGLQVGGCRVTLQRVMVRLLVVLSLVLPCALPSLASAQQPEPANTSETATCPPGWYCEPLPEDEATTPRGPVEPEPPPSEEAPEPEELEGEQEAEAPPPGYAPRVILVPRSAVDRPAPPQPTAWPRLRVLGRLGLPLFDGGAHESAGMFAAGVGLSYALQRSIAIEGALDAASGTDYVGADRQELWASGSIVLSPRARGAVPYTMIGPSFAVASSELRGNDRNFAYLGAHLGIGIAFEVAENSRLQLEWLGFVRGRIDSGDSPEYVDYRTGRATNTSGGAVLRLGISYGL